MESGLKGRQRWSMPRPAISCSSLAARSTARKPSDTARSHEQIGAEDDLATQVLRRSAKAKVLSLREANTRPPRVLARAAVALAEGTDDTNMCADSLMDLALVLSATGDSAERVDAIRRARDLYVRNGNVVSALVAEQLERTAG